MVWITFWKSEEAMRATEQDANQLREESAEVLRDGDAGKVEDVLRVK
mgnify:CR=1 FL=1